MVKNGVGVTVHVVGETFGVSETLKVWAAATPHAAAGYFERQQHRQPVFVF